ncbi:MAG: TlpA family protein disulfide reductase [Algoriphagus aquaeductus]|uniref:TlpA family protein disulfide reductase n=1 Tax=Algoriphagus aquaeductus TaxID=475299 RepID=UPI003879773E
MTRFHIELPNTTAPDTLRLTYWDHFLKEHREVTPGTSMDLIADRGSFFEGNAGYKVYRWEMEGMEATRVFSIRMGSHLLIRYWNLPPGAQVKVRMELNSGVTYFWGPSSRFFKAQQEVDRLASEQSWQQSPLMVTNNPERMLSDSLISHYHQKSLSLPQELYLPMFFVVGGKSDRELLETYLSKPLEDYPLIRELAPLTEGMSETSKNLLVQRAYGETLRQLVSKLKLGRSWLKEEPFSTRFEAMLRELPIPTADQELDPVFLSAIYELVLLKGSIDRVPITRMLENYPATVSDRVLGLYLLDNFKRLEEHQNQYLADVLREVELPWVQELILDLKSRSLSGNTLMAPPLSDMEGKPFDLARLEGKAMVVSFWITGCRFCMRYYQNTLKEVYERWSDREEVVFVSVNADPNSQKWKESVATELYSHPKMIQLHQDAGSGILADFRISSFPQKLLITPDRKIFLLTLTQYSPDQLSEKIAQLLAQPEISQETKNTGF